MPTKKLQTALLFFVFGVVSAFISLLLMSVLPAKFANNETVLSISFLATIEELVKFSVLYFIYSTHDLKKFNNLFLLLVLPLLFGFGFSFFELSMIYFQQSQLPLEAFYPTLVHITSALLLTSGINLIYKQRNLLLTASPPLLAALIHICYNVTIVKII